MGKEPVQEAAKADYDGMFRRGRGKKNAWLFSGRPGNGGRGYQTAVL